MNTVPFRSAISLLSATALSVISIFLVASAAPEGVQATSTIVNYDIASGGNISTWDGNISTETYNIAASPDGSVYVAGKYRYTAAWGSIQLSSSKEAGYLAKLGPDGVWDWVVDAKDSASCCSSSQVEDVVALDDGSAIFLIDAGFSMGFTNPVTGAAETFSATGDTSIVARIAADGTFMWFKELHGSPENPFSLALSADGSTVVAIASHSPSTSSTIQVEAINSATGSSEWLVGNIVFSGGASRDSYWPQVAINDSGTAVVSLSYYGGDVVVNGVSYNSKDNNNEGNGATQTIFVAYDISTSNVEWVSRTRKSATVNVYWRSTTAGFYSLAASGDNFLALMKVLGGSSNGTLAFADASNNEDITYTTDFNVSSDEDEGYVVVELSDAGDWVEKTRVTYCADAGSDCGFSSVYDEKSLHVASDGSFDIFSSAESSATSIAGMDFLGSDDTSFVASFNSDGSPEKLTSFSNCAEPGWYNAIDSFSDGTLVIAGTQECPGPIGDSLGNTVTTNTTQWAEFVMPLANGPWVYNTAAGPANTISFDASGGTGAPGPQYCDSNEVITISSVVPTRDGYTFAGWDTGANNFFGDRIIHQPNHTIICGNGDSTLTAMWEAATVSYDVTYEYGNGDPDAALTCQEGTSLAVADAPTRPGYEFIRWVRLGNPSGSFGYNDPGDTVSCDEDVSFTAQWEAMEYTVTYSLGNGEPDAALTCQEGISFTVADAPTRQWFIFNGWSTQDFGIVQPGDDVPCSEMTLTAIWSADTTDTDGDGVIDSEEETGCENTADCDSDGLTDDLDADDLDSDQDDDSVLDGAEEDSSCITVADCDSDGLTDDLDADDLDSDQDDDGVLDGAEQDSSCITATDCDNDGLADALDQDDLDSDQDDDGVLDGQDPDHATTDTDGDGIPDVSEIEGCENTNDCDNDGVLDGAEEANVCITDPDCDDDGLGDADDADDLNADQDGDGIQDGDEQDASCVAVADCDGDGLTDPYDTDDLDSDQDDDGVLDGDETAGCVTVPDCDDDGLGDADDADDLNADQDGDGIQDGDDPTPQFADSDQDGVENAAETEGCELNPDCDSDGLGDADDSDDTNPDQDADGVQDGGEEDLSCVNTSDCDQDGVNDADETQGCALSTDCDGDTISDAEDGNDLVRLDNDDEPVVQTTGDFAAAESQGECRSITNGSDADVGVVTNLDNGSVECASSDGEIKIKLERVASRSSGSTAMALQLVAGGQGVASGEGFRPFTRAEIWIASTPTLLKTVEVPASGSWVAVFDVPADLEPGNHTVQAEGLGVDGQLRAANLGVVVEAPPTPTTTTTTTATQTPVSNGGSGTPSALPALPPTGFGERAPLAVVMMGLALALYLYGYSSWMADRRKMAKVAA